MSDDAEGAPIIAVTDTDFNGSDWPAESLAKYSEYVTALRAIKPSAKIGANTRKDSYAYLSDWNLHEYNTFNWVSGFGIAKGGDYGSPAMDMQYDDYLPANNPNGVVGLLIYYDADNGSGMHVWHSDVPWDRANRGPILALSKHLIAQNQNTIFGYFSHGGYWYSETDEVILKDGSTWHQATQGTPALSQVFRWGMWFPAMGVDFGIPDVSGWNGGVRSLSWKSHTEIGGSMDVWRRDYTNAIVLHRPSIDTTTSAEYNTPSSVMALGGTYYPLRADGTVSAGITSISLRHGEGAILMKPSALQ